MAEAYFDGALVLDWSDSVGHSCKLRISDWDTGFVVTRCELGEDDELSIIDVGDWIFSIHDPAIEAWRNTMPRALDSALDSWPSRHASIVRWAIDSEIVRDLLVSNPLLLWLLVDSGLFARASLGEINRKLSVKQRVLCSRLELTGTEQQVRILKRAASANLLIKSIRKLKKILRDREICKYLRHQPKITSSIISLLECYPWMVMRPARSLIDDLQDHETLRCFEDVVRMLFDLEPLYNCRTTAALWRLHDRVVAELNADDGFRLIRDESGRVLELPAQPLPGNEVIQPLKTQQQIVDEGREMKHCVASYVAPVIDGSYYLYRMEEPERLTIGVRISRGPDGRYGQCLLREVRGKCNRYPSAASMRLIENWFENSQSAASG